MDKRVTARGLLIMPDANGTNSLALVHRLKPNKNDPSVIDDFYVTPGGGIENGEDVFHAVEREVFEELGVIVHADRTLYTEETDINIHHYVLCTYQGGKFGTGTGPEFTDPTRLQTSGQYIPVLIALPEISRINLVPPNFKTQLTKDLNASNFTIAHIQPKNIN